MKQFILLTLILIVFGCEEPKEVYESSIRTYKISYIEKVVGYKGYTTYYIYFQTATSTESAIVDLETYNKYEVGDTIQVLIKYWEKPKRKK
jgi:hypothetical protein